MDENKRREGIEFEWSVSIKLVTIMTTMIDFGIIFKFLSFIHNL